MADLIEVEDLFSDGNAFSILGKCKRAARKAGWTNEEITAFFNKAMSADYDNLLVLVMSKFEEKDEEQDDDFFDDEDDFDEEE